ncbi:nuclear transport factor 2 family protein [Amycolatopsis sp. NPDC026612]|uniref:nuclear transport factor 2 family protein n=1 Tax=Amycolatopsis sp. NPDC026612 TaxID=3155466 RepID=UPI0033EA132B
MSLTHPLPAPARRSTPVSRADRLALLHRELEALQARSDRSDPLDETLLCLTEAAAHAAAAAERLQAFPLDGAERTAELGKLLAAARAAVVCATYAMADAPARPDRSRTMSQPTTTAATEVSGADLARRFYECVDAGDFTALVALFTEDCEYHRPGYRPWFGRAGLTTFYREERVISSGAHTLTAVLADGPHVAVHGRFDGLLRTGAEISIGFADFFERDGTGLFRRRHTYYFAPLA